MARDFKIKARFVAEDKASPTLAKLQRTQAALTKGVEAAGVAFRKGDLSVDRYLKALDKAVPGQKKLNRALEASSTAVVKTQSKFSKFSEGLQKNFIAIGAAVAVVGVAFRGLSRLIGSSIAKANEQEVAINQLNAALSELGPTADSVSESLQAQAAALQQVTTFGDEQIIAAQTQIASFIKQEDQIKAATKATLDFSVAFGIDLKGSAALVAKTLGSTTNALTRYGVEVQGAVGSTERLNSLVENIAKVAGGRAAAAVDTFSGAWTQFTNVIGDTQEKLAGLLTQSEGVVGLIKSATVALDGTTKAVSDTASGMKLFVKNLEEAEGPIAISQQLLGGLVLKLEGISLGIKASTKGWDEFVSRFPESEANFARLNAVMAKQAAIEGELDANLIKLNDRWNLHNIALLEAIGAAEHYNNAAGITAERTRLLRIEQELLAAQLEAGEEAFLRLGAAISVVTSLELERQLQQMQADLEAVRKSTIGSTAEFVDYERIAGEKIELLRDRIQSLKDGMGDLVPVQRVVSDGFIQAASAADVQSQSIDRLIGRYVDLVIQENELTQAQQRRLNLAGGLTDASGRPLTQAEQRRQRLGERGRFTGFDISGGTFTTIKRVGIDDNGNVSV